MFLNLGGCRVSRRCINQISRRQPKTCARRTRGTPEHPPQRKCRAAREAGESRVGADPGLSVQKTSGLIKIDLDAVHSPAFARQLRHRGILHFLNGLPVPEKDHATLDGRARRQPNSPRRTERNLITHDAAVCAVVRREAEAACVAEQVEGDVAVPAPQGREQTLRVERPAFFEEHVVAYYAEAARVWVELEVQAFLAGLFL